MLAQPDFGGQSSHFSNLTHLYVSLNCCAIVRKSFRRQEVVEKSKKKNRTGAVSIFHHFFENWLSFCVFKKNVTNLKRKYYYIGMIMHHCNLFQVDPRTLESQPP